MMAVLMLRVCSSKPVWWVSGMGRAVGSERGVGREHQDVTNARELRRNSPKR